MKKTRSVLNTAFKAALIAMLANPLAAQASSHGGEAIIIGIGMVLVAFIFGLISGAHHRFFFNSLFQGLGVSFALVIAGLVISSDFKQFDMGHLENVVTVLIELFFLSGGFFLAGYVPGRIFIWLALLVQKLFSNEKPS